MLFILDEEDKPRTLEDINRIVSAEIPDPITHPLAYETVTNSMIHGPCGLLNPEAPCMKNDRCTKNYPFNFAKATTLMGEENENNNGKLTYRRRIMIDRIVLRNSGRTTISNRWIVPHIFTQVMYIRQGCYWQRRCGECCLITGSWTSYDSMFVPTT
ncbi:hypothetical protein PS15m_012312 [Mucor circinelloides]